MVGGGFFPVIPAKAGNQRRARARLGCAGVDSRACARRPHPSLLPSRDCRGRLTEIKRRAKPTDPFPLYGGRLGWGCRGRLARVPGRKPALASLSRKKGFAARDSCLVSVSVSFSVLTPSPPRRRESRGARAMRLVLSPLDSRFRGNPEGRGLRVSSESGFTGL